MSKLNIDQKKLKGFSKTPNHFFLSLTISDLMLGETRNAKLYGKTFSLLLFQMEIATNLTKAASISSDQ